MLKFSKLFLLLTLISLVSVANAQITRKTTPKEKKAKTEKLFDESGGFKHRLWYGGGLNLNFGAATNYVNTFRFGLSPMVGYKITDKFSIGPRIAVNYNYIKGTTINNEIKSSSLVDYSVGVFARYKIFQGFFAHVEYDFESFQNYFIDYDGRLGVDQNNNVIKVRNSRSNFYPGVGYNSGGLLSMDIMLLYNYQLGQDKTTNQLPIEYRIGFTYKF